MSGGVRLVVLLAVIGCGGAREPEIVPASAVTQPAPSSEVEPEPADDYGVDPTAPLPPPPPLPREARGEAAGRGVRRGAGTGSGSGFGSGHGRLGGSHMSRGESSEPPAAPRANPMETVQELIDRLGIGNIAFSPPTMMQMGDKKSVELLLSSEYSTAALRDKLPRADRSTAETAIVRVAPRMEAALVGAGFAVEATVPAEQVVVESQTTRWAWDVTPTASGRQSLHLSLAAKIEVEGHDTPFVVRTFDREIVVVVTAQQRVASAAEKYGSWAWGALVVPVAGFLWKKWRDRRRASA